MTASAAWFTPPDTERRATRMPEGFQPKAHHLALAAELGVDLEEEFSIFVDHHLSKGNKFKSWDRALNTWLRRERKFSRPNHPPSSVTPVLRPCPLGRCDGSGVRSSYFTPGKFVVCECDQKRYSTNFPTTTNAIQTTTGGPPDAFVTALNPLGTGLVYSSYLGGSGTDLGSGIALDASFSAYVTGFTDSTNFPTTAGAFQTTAPGGRGDAFVVKIAQIGGPVPTTLSFTAASATTSDFHDAARVQAKLTTTGGVPVPNETVTFTLGSGSSAPTCSATTDATGTATCLLTPNQAAGPVTLTATFAGDASFGGSSASTTFTVTKEETTLKFTATSPTVLANGQPAAFSATLKEDGTTPISGRSVTITLGSGAGAQSCIGTTDSSGTATCTIVVNQPLGPNNVAANFSGDAFYQPSSDTEAVVVFAFLGSGSFVIGDLNAAPGNGVTFWGAQWAIVNSLSGGPAPDAFKGFADTAPQSCGGTWTSSPGNSSNPPGSVPSFMAVIASSSISKSGPTLSGNVPKIVIIKTNPGYGPSPGHAGTGTVVSVVCGR